MASTLLLQSKELLEGQRKALAEAADLNKQAARLSSPATFAQGAKLQRKAIALEKQAQLQELQQVSAVPLLCVEASISDLLWARSSLSTSMQGQLSSSVVQKTLTACKYLVLAVLLCITWRQPAALAPPTAVWPLGRWLRGMLDKQTWYNGTIAAVPWFVLSDRAAFAMARCLAV